ncbi:MAG: enoyl-CoA hydratase/isomerase family protein, partial [Candidatus Zixiibacteriota bacterium]
KPIVAAINGHAIAGGCMLANACDYRIMVTGKTKIGLNEVRIGASVFAGSVEMLKCAAGHRNAETILLDGGMYSADRARELGLVDKVTTDDQLTADATDVAQRLASGSSRAFGSIKGLLHNPVAAEFDKREQAAIDEFVDIWYSPETRELLKSVVIR